ncbi:MAG TPA: DNA-3-methyladenine glycosylase I, partial [Afipia sp.]
ANIPTSTPESIAMSKELLKHGFKFVGPTIVYAFMQATGMVNDHLQSCHCYGAAGKTKQSVRAKTTAAKPARAKKIPPKKK